MDDVDSDEIDVVAQPSDSSGFLHVAAGGEVGRSGLNRRQVIVGAASVAALPASALAAGELQVWSVSLEPDPLLPGRSIVAIAFGDNPKAERRRYREISFGEHAKARIVHTALPSFESAAAVIRDIRLTIAGLELARAGAKPDFFEIVFEFLHRGTMVALKEPERKPTPVIVTTRSPAVRISAFGWIFGPSGAVLAPSVGLPAWSAAEPIAATNSAALADAMRQSVFGERLPRPKDGSPLSLAIRLPRQEGAAPGASTGVQAHDAERDRAFGWIIGVSAKEPKPGGGLAVLTHPTGRGLTAARAGQSRLLWAEGVDVWRQVPAAVPQETVAKQLPATAGATPQVPARANRPAQLAPQREAFDDIPRTIGELRGVRLGEQTRTVLAEHSIGNGHVSCAVIDKAQLRSGSNVRLTRVDGSGRFGLASQLPQITTVADLVGDLAVVTGRAKKTSRQEGPFALESGRIELSGPPDATTLDLAARFDLGRAAADASTAHGSMVVSSPEEKSAEPGSPVGRTPVRIGAKNWRMHLFEMTARVHSVAVALQSPVSPATYQDSSAQAYGVELTFPSGAEVIYRLHGLDDAAATRPGIGRISLGWTPGAKPGPRAFGERFSLPLEGGELKLLRWRDLAAMTYRFSGLDLVYGDDGSVLKPRGLARAHSAGSADFPGRLRDPRPMIVVELPPQHVAEEAFLEQRKLRPSLPAYPLDALGALDAVGPSPSPARRARQVLDELRDAYPSQPAKGGLPRKLPQELAEQRLLWRQELSKLVDALAAGPPEGPVGRYKDVRDKFAAAAAEKRLPQEQRVYVGPEFLDPAARLVAETVAGTGAPTTALFDEAPDDPVPQQEQEALRDNAARKVADGDKAKIEAEVASRVSLLRSVRDPFFVEFKAGYDKPPPPLQRPKPLADRPELQVFSGAKALRAAIEAMRRTPPGGGKPAISDDELAQISAFVRAVAAKALHELGLDGGEEPTKIARARLSGTSRLAFRINTDDYERAGGAIPFTFDELTNWSRHELAVVRRAEKTFKTYDDLSHRPAWDRVEDFDLGNQLLHQGFSRHVKPGAAVSAEQRLAEASAFASAPPSPFETAIEMPFRLLLSPAQDGRFRTRRAVPGQVLSPLHPLYGPASELEVDPLWTAELQPDADMALRAVWSPDFRPEAFLRDGEPASSDNVRQPRPARRNRVPLRGPYAPWAIGRDLSKAGDFKPSPPPKFRTSLDAFDRHELVALTSVHGLPVMGRLKPETNSRIGIDQREPPPGFQVATSGWDKSTIGAEDGPGPTPWLDNDVYVPRRLDPDGLELALSALGGFLRVNASFEPPASVLDGHGDPFFDALSIERWRHRIVLGRDISAEVVYKGYLFPLGNRCTLVKITERRFQKVIGRSGPVAVLRQRMLLRVGKPEKGFPAFRQADDGRRVPFTNVRIVTTTTPDLVDPFDQSGAADDVGILPSGLIDLGGSRGAAFWPRTARRRGGEVKFDIMLDGAVPIRMPLIFVDNAAANDQQAIDALCRHYNALGAAGADARALALVTIDVNGAKLTYGPQKEAGDTRFETLALTFGAEGRPPPERPQPTGYDPLARNLGFSSDAFMQGADQPPFYPAMRRATIKLAQVERLTTQAVPAVEVAYDASYALAGFTEAVPGKTPDTRDEILLSVLGPAPPFPSDRRAIAEVRSAGLSSRSERSRERSARSGPTRSPPRLRKTHCPPSPS